MTATIRNPILSGFHPDPSIVRAGDDYFLATSTFHWWPGVRIHHSHDLVHWRPLGYALTRPSQLDMIGVHDHAGVWAPCLSFDHKTSLFFLVYTIVQSRPGYFDDLNYVVTAQNPAGPWSDPVFLNGVGFDASLFHDEDGRKWLVQMATDPRPARNRFAGIRLQEYDPQAQKLIGPGKIIFQGTTLGLVEGPHLYRKDGWYYLLTAEGGTSYEHAVTLARSQSIWGPYQVHPDNPLLTSLGDDTNPLQKAGHGSLVQTPDSTWWLAHLCGRPLPGTRRCPLGRETALQLIEWEENGWPHVAGGGNRPQIEWPVQGVEPNNADPGPLDQRIEFPKGPLHDELNTLRAPADPSWLETGVDGTWLRMVGRSSLESLRHQSLVGRRLAHHRAELTTRMIFEPESCQQMAGLTIYYDTTLHHYLYLTRDQERGLYLAVLTSDRGQVLEPQDAWLCVEGWPQLHLRASIDHGSLQFSASADNTTWAEVGPALDLSILSDDYAPHLGFTGTYAALAVQDLAGEGRAALFQHLTYVGFPEDNALDPANATSGQAAEA
ncbi:MAG: glycoside hydrolase family 43 protein [Phycisphaeraceae bacterium]